MLQTLDTIVGVTFIFLLFSLVVSAAQEVLAAALRLRGRVLKTGLDAMLKSLGGDKLAADFWSHGFIASLQPSGKPPSYMPSTNIAAALLHIAAGNKPGEAVDVAALPEALKGNTGIGQTKLATVLATLLEQTGSRPTLPGLEAAVTKWVDVTMERVSSLYQRRTRVVLLVISLVFAGIMNIDAVNIWQGVQGNKALREALVAAVENRPKTSPPGETNANPQTLEQSLETYKKVRHELEGLELPIGWTAESARDYAGFWAGALHVCGILLSAFAASLGAPFWFDLLQRFVNIRSVVKPGEKPAKPAGN